MTIKEIIVLADEVKPNDLPMAQKVRWIAELDGKIAVDVFQMGVAELEQFAYKEEDAAQTTPLVKFPHDDLYRLWVLAMIDFANGEYGKYQNSAALYNEAYGNFVRWFARHYKMAAFSGKLEEAAGYYITAYGLAVKAGYEGTLEQWLDSLRGPAGASAYELAVKAGYTESEEKFYLQLTKAGLNAWEYAKEGGYKKDEKSFATLLGTLEDQLADKAPAGFGLGGAQKIGGYGRGDVERTEQCLDNTFAPGWYYVNGDLNLGFGGAMGIKEGSDKDSWNYAMVHVTAVGNGKTHGHQELHIIGQSYIVLARDRYSGKWRNVSENGGWYYQRTPLPTANSFNYCTPFEVKWRARLTDDSDKISRLYIRRIMVPYASAGKTLEIGLGKGVRPLAVFGWDAKRMLPFNNQAGTTISMWSYYDLGNYPGEGAIFVKSSSELTQYINLIVLCTLE